MNKNKSYKLFLLMLCCSPVLLKAEEAAASSATEVKHLYPITDINMILSIVAYLLVIPIYFALRNFSKSAEYFIMRQKAVSGKGKTLLMLFFAFSISALQANTETPTSIIPSTGVSYFILSIIALELLILTYINYINSEVVAKNIEVEHPELITTKVVNESLPIGTRIKNYWNSVNNFVPLEEEANIDTGHSYDGIRELDNVTPPWFTFAFACSIVFAIVYMYMHHVSKSAPLQIQEYETEIVQAEKEGQKLLAQEANNIDENSIVMLGPEDIKEGQAIFVQKCAACHEATGGSKPGGVGPNLTDKYWIHNGGIKDIFKSIKYGWPDKGMISWKDQIPPKGIAQLASFITTLQGSNPPNAKEAQGEIYEAKSATAVDTTKVSN